MFGIDAAHISLVLNIHVSCSMGSAWKANNQFPVSRGWMLYDNHFLIADDLVLVDGATFRRWY